MVEAIRTRRKDLYDSGTHCSVLKVVVRLI